MCPNWSTTSQNARAVADSTAPAQNLVGRGIILMLLANLLFSFVDTSTKWLIGAGLVAVQLAFMRYAVQFALTIVEQGWRFKSRYSLSWRLRGVVSLRAFCLVSATLVNFIAIGHLPLSITSAILFLAPVFVCLFAGPMLGEDISTRHWIGVAFGFLGVLVILWPFGKPISWYAVLMIYHTGGLGTLVLLPVALFVWVSPSTWLAWVLMLAIGGFAWAGHQALINAHDYAAASTLAPIGYSFVIYLTLAGWLIFDEIPTVNVAVGALMIFGAAMFAWRKV